MSRAGVIAAALVSALLAVTVVVTRTTSLWNGVGLGVLVLAVWLATRPSGRVDPTWPVAPRENRPGGRTDVSELSWTAFTRNGMVTERVLRRVRAIAARRLAQRGILWDGRLPEPVLHHGEPVPAAVALLRGWGTGPGDAADHRRRAAELLGPQVLDELSTARAVPPRTLEHWLRTLDQLVAPPPGTTTSTTDLSRTDRRSPR